jgi:nucleotide-binding universal stress UspA family protein
MTNTTDSAQGDTVTRVSIFDRVMVGVDGSEPGFEACRQAALLAEPRAAIEAVAVVHLGEAVLTGPEAPRVAEELERDAERALAEAVRIVGERAATRFVNGVPTESLLSEVEAMDASVLIIGSHGHRRMTEILIGGVAGELLHSAPCSLLVARAPSDPASFPQSIVVGVDGSPEAEAALAAGRQLATRFDVPLLIVVALRGKDVDVDRVRRQAPLVEEVDEDPVHALVEAARDAGIVVIGSRGLHGLRALGSVSERVAHQAACSVLVLRAEGDA